MFCTGTIREQGEDSKQRMFTSPLKGKMRTRSVGHQDGDGAKALDPARRCPSMAMEIDVLEAISSIVDMGDLAADSLGNTDARAATVDQLDGGALFLELARDALLGLRDRRGSQNHGRGLHVGRQQTSFRLGVQTLRSSRLSGCSCRRGTRSLEPCVSLFFFPESLLLLVEVLQECSRRFIRAVLSECGALQKVSHLVAVDRRERLLEWCHSWRLGGGHFSPVSRVTFFGLVLCSGFPAASEFDDDDRHAGEEEKDDAQEDEERDGRFAGVLFVSNHGGGSRGGCLLVLKFEPLGCLGFVSLNGVLFLSLKLLAK